MGGTAGQRIGLILGPIIAIGLQLVPVPDGLSREAWLLASIALLMATWWASEAIPIAATALLPLALFPFLGIASAAATAAPYASPIVMLLLGGFIIALAIERWGLHARIALHVVAAFGGRPAFMILGFMVAAALLSMWISNTATTLMMIPIAMKVAQELEAEGASGPAFATALALGVAYAASVGGVATPVGTPTNLIGLGYLQNEFERTISFPEWMAVGLPVVALLIPAMCLVISRFVFAIPMQAPASATGRETVAKAIGDLGPMSAPEVRVASVFAVVALLWMGSRYVWNPLLAAAAEGFGLPVTPAFSNMQIAIFGAVALFLIPAGGERGAGRRLMTWEDTARLPWSVVVLFGGGLSLAAAIEATGLAAWLGQSLAPIGALPTPVIVLILCLIVVFLTEMTSNVATVSGFLPVMGALAGAAGVPPEYLIIPVAMAASCAFMLPVATAPNAIVYASGAVSMAQIIRTGVRLNLLAAPVIALIASLLTPLVFPG